MTRTQAVWLAVIGAILGIGMIVLHMFMPFNVVWPVNRWLHYGWLATVALAVAGSGAWMMWPRQAAPRRDEQRIRARRRTLALALVVVAGVGLVVFAEMHRELRSRRRLSNAAGEHLADIAKALEKYAADHQNAAPPSLRALAPQYIEPGRLMYVFRNGPVPAEPPAGLPDDASISFRIAPEPPVAADSKPAKRQAHRITAYLRPGNAWAPLTAVLEEGGLTRVVGEDEVRQFEKAAKPAD